MHYVDHTTALPGEHTLIDKGSGSAEVMTIIQLVGIDTPSSGKVRLVERRGRTGGPRPRPLILLPRSVRRARRCGRGPGHGKSQQAVPVVVELGVVDRECPADTERCRGASARPRTPRTMSVRWRGRGVFSRRLMVAPTVPIGHDSLRFPCCPVPVRAWSRSGGFNVADGRRRGRIGRVEPAQRGAEGDQWPYPAAGSAAMILSMDDGRRCYVARLSDPARTRRGKRRFVVEQDAPPAGGRSSSCQ